jgi:putative addiction module component (TIGR02574 family)
MMYEPFVLADYVCNPVALARIKAGVTLGSARSCFQREVGSGKKCILKRSVHMTLSFEMVEAQAMALGSSDRARLLDRLVHHLEDDESIAEDWMQEAMRRDAEMDANPVLGIPHELVMANLRAGLR